MGKSREEVERILKTQDVIELNLSERKTRGNDKDEGLRIFE